MTESVEGEPVGEGRTVRYDIHCDVSPHGPGGLKRCGLCDEVWPCSAILSERARVAARPPTVNAHRTE